MFHILIADGIHDLVETFVRVNDVEKILLFLRGYHEISLYEWRNKVSNICWNHSIFNFMHKIQFLIGKSSYARYSSMPPSTLPIPEGGGILLLVRIPSASALALASAPAFISVHCILDQLMNFDQTCIDTLFGGREELIRF